MQFRILLLVAVLSYQFSLFGQCPIVEFTAPGTLCLDQEFIPINTTTGGDTYFWDFCEGDLSTTPTPNLLFRIPGANDVRGLELVEDDGLWYGFATNRGINSVFRFDFGNSINNPAPSITPIEGLSDLLDGPEPIQILKEGDNWFGIIHNGSSGAITLLQFGSSLENELPISANILTGVGGVNTTMEVARDGASTILIFNTADSRHLRINFGSSVTNSVDISDVVDDGVISGIANPSGNIRGFELVNFCDQWYSMAVSFNGKRLYILDYGTELFAKPTLSINENNIFDGESPYRIEVGVDVGSYYALISTSVGSIFRVPIGSNPGLVSPGLTATRLLDVGGGSESLFGFNLIKDVSDWRIFMVNTALRDLYRVDFINNCPNSNPISNDFIPSLTSYSTAGDYSIGLEVRDTDGNRSFSHEVVTVTDDQAPTISFTNQTFCLSSPIQFSSESNGSGLTYAWDFGDGSSSGDEDPVHVYTSAGVYEVTLSIDDGTCGNFTRQMITIYEEPIPDFTLPTGVICTNQQVVFANDTPGNFDGLITYEWQVDGVTEALSEDFTFEFSSGGDKAIKLIASIPGCTLEIEKSLLGIREGALPDFTFNDACLGEIVAFDNQSVGSIVSNNWDFGNGFTSSLENPALQFTQDGTFDITLSITNTDGCITTLVRPITIHALPVVNFENELACENLSTQFTDLTTVDLDNLDQWSWNFGDGSSVVTTQNPTYTYNESGNYNVKLVTTSSFGCVDSLTQVVSVLPSPVASFTTDRICLGVPISFEDTSTPVVEENITSWAWSLGGEFSPEQNPETTFDTPLDYEVSLSVTSENLCSSTITEVLTISPAPEVSFSITDNCENQLVVLTDNTFIEGDIINDYSWIYDDNEFSMGSATTQFSEIGIGNYDVVLEIETEKGCEYVGTSSFSINQAPTASFTSSLDFGAPPLLVDFTNNSEGAVSYTWDFKDGNTSLEENVSNTFSQLGEYDVELVAFNEFGCSDTLSQRISVLQPELNLSLLNLAVVESSIGDMLSLTIQNSGSLTLDSINVVLDLGGELILNEVIATTLFPNQTITTQLGFSFSNRKLDYLCAIIDPVVSVEETEIDDNEKCLIFNETEVVIAPPSPNPSRGQFSFDIVAVETSRVSVSIIDSQGKTVSNFVAAKSAGNDTLVVDMSNEKEGIYLISINVDGSSRLFRVMLTD